MDNLFKKTEECVIGCFPILCLKANNEENSFLNEIYNRVPKADYYKYNMGGLKPELGTYQIFKTPGKPSILNCYVKTYPGSFKSDNLDKRREYFEKILTDVLKKNQSKSAFDFYFSASDIKGMEDIVSRYNGIILELPSETIDSPPFDPKDIQKVVLYPNDYVRFN